MRRSEQDQKRRIHRETDIPNVGTSRNSRRTSVKGNPIQVPSNNSYAELASVSKISQKSKIIGNMHTKNQSRRAERYDKPNSPPKRASARIVLSKRREEKKKEDKEDVIEIDSDPESHRVDLDNEFEDPEEPEELEEKPRKRRLIQYDPDEFEEEQRLQLPRPPRRKTANSPLNISPSKPYVPSQSASTATAIQKILHLRNAPDNPNMFLDEYFKHSEHMFEEPPLMLHSRISADKEKSKFGDKYVVGQKEFYPEEDDFEEEKLRLPPKRSALKTRELAGKSKQAKEPPKSESELPSKASSKNNSTPTSPSDSPKRSTRQIVKRPLSPDPIDDYVIEPTGSDEHILNYPFNKRKSITVYERDFERLEDETYLNDTLIDVFPKIWADEYPAASIYTFSSFFFTKLSGPYSSIHYDTVQRWTSSIDVFKKKYIIIPVAQNNHWFILLVVNPGYCIQGSKGLEYHKQFPDLEEETTPKPTRKKIITAGTALNPNKPYIMALDPLGLNKQTTAKCVLQYLKKEAITKLNIEESDFLAPDIVMSACPGQDNFTDCGVFCLHYMKSLYQYPDIMMDVLYNNQKNDENWDLDKNIGNFRAVLKRVLKKKMKDYRELMFSELMG